MVQFAARLSLGFSKKLENLEAAVAIFLAYYNYVWRTRMAGKSGQLRVPAAMAAGVTGSLMSFANPVTMAGLFRVRLESAA